jgi:hypothetical protein
MPHYPAMTTRRPSQSAATAPAPEGCGGLSASGQGPGAPEPTSPTTPTVETTACPRPEYFTIQNWLLRDLRPHPENYRSHPPDQLDHIKHSLTELGQYKNVVVKPDGTILAGHGVVTAARELGWEKIAVRVFDGSPEQCRLLMIADNELSRRAEDDDRMLTELLRELNTDIGLQGTGYDEAMLANLLLVTRTEDEIPDFDAAAEWVGMPENSPTAAEDVAGLRIIVHFANETDRDQFILNNQLKPYGMGTNSQTMSAKWPQTPLRRHRDFLFDEE